MYAGGEPEWLAEQVCVLQKLPNTSYQAFGDANQEPSNVCAVLRQKKNFFETIVCEKFLDLGVRTGGLGEAAGHEVLRATGDNLR